LKYLKAFPGGETIRLDQVNEQWFENFQKYLLKNTGLSGASANSYAVAIRIALAKATHENIIPRNPAEAVRAISIPEADKVFLNPTEIQRLADTPLNGELGGKIRKAFLFSCFTGFRGSDLKCFACGENRFTVIVYITKKPFRFYRRAHTSFFISMAIFTA
jgi:integrase